MTTATNNRPRSRGTPSLGTRSSGPRKISVATAISIPTPIDSATASGAGRPASSESGRVTTPTAKARNHTYLRGNRMPSPSAIPAAGHHAVLARAVGCVAMASQPTTRMATSDPTINAAGAAGPAECGGGERGGTLTVSIVDPCTVICAKRSSGGESKGPAARPRGTVSLEIGCQHVHFAETIVTHIDALLSSSSRRGSRTTAPIAVTNRPWVLAIKSSSANDPRAILRPNIRSRRPTICSH